MYTRMLRMYIWVYLYLNKNVYNNMYMNYFKLDKIYNLRITKHRNTLSLSCI